jgi:hypothetical protein
MFQVSVIGLYSESLEFISQPQIPVLKDPFSHFKTQWLLYIPPSLALRLSALFRHRVRVCSI